MSIVANGKEVLIENIPIEQRDDKLIMQFSKKVAETFANAPYNQYMVHESDLSRYISPEEIFGTKDYIPYDQLFSNHQGNGYFYADNPEVAFKIWKEKLLLKDSVLILVRTSDSDEIQGGIFTYKSTLENAFKRYEEWENPLLYAGIQNEEIYRNYEELILALNDDFDINIKVSNILMVWNLIFLTPIFRNSIKVLIPLVAKLLVHLPDENIPLIGETMDDIAANKLFNYAKPEKVNYSFNSIDVQHHLIFVKNVQLGKSLLFNKLKRFF
jgi:hypothetical protein